jgi:hypothetical protein
VNCHLLRQGLTDLIDVIYLNTDATHFFWERIQESGDRLSSSSETSGGGEK